MTHQELAKGKVKRFTRAKRLCSAALLCAGMLGTSVASPTPAAAAITPIITVGGGWAEGVLQEYLAEGYIGDEPDIKFRTNTPIRITGSDSNLKVRLLVSVKKAAIWWDAEVKLTFGVSCAPGSSGAIAVTYKDVQLSFDKAVLAAAIPGLKIALNRLANEAEPYVEKELVNEIKSVYLKPHADLVKRCPLIVAASNGDLTMDYRAGTECSHGTKRTEACQSGYIGEIYKTCENGRWFISSTCEPSGGGGGGPIGGNGGTPETP